MEQRELMMEGGVVGVGINLVYPLGITACLYFNA